MESSGGFGPPCAGLQPAAYPLGHDDKMALRRGVDPRSPARQAGILPMNYRSEMVQGVGVEPTQPETGGLQPLGLANVQPLQGGGAAGS